MHRFRFAAVAVAVSAVAAIVGPGPAAAAPGLASAGAHAAVGTAALAPDTSLMTLFDNNSNDSGIGIVSQNFEPDFDVYDSEGADDFTVPGGQVWKVSKVIVTGVYFNGEGPASSENVRFYTNRGSLPNGLKNEYLGLVGTDNGSGSFEITLPTAATLPGGSDSGDGKTYWVSVQVNMDFNSGGEWGWENSGNSVGSGAVWRNPNGGFGLGCATFTLETDCIPDGQGPSKMFALAGVDLLQ